MNYKIIFTKSYTKRAAKFLKKYPELIKQYEKTLKLMALNPYHRSLHLHKLKGRISDLNTVSINISFSISIGLIIVENTIIPVHVGTHDEVYL